LQPNFGSGLRTSPGNQWSNTLYQLPGRYHAYNGNGSGAFLTFFSQVFPNTCNIPYWPPTIYPTQNCAFTPPEWFTLAEALVSDCQHDAGCPTLDFGNPLVDNNDYLSIIDTLISQGELLTADHGECLNFEGQKRVFAKLHEHPELRIEESPTDSFYLANLNTDLYSLYRVDSLRYKAMSSGSEFIELLNQSNDTIRHYVAVLKTLDSLYTLATTNEDSTALENQMIATSTILEESNASIVYEINQLRSHKSPLIALAQLINNGVSENGLLYSNLVSVNGIYLRTIAIGVDTLTNGQKDTLLYISNQCPLDGGKAVYMARSLYNLYAPLDINDDSICVPPVLPIIFSNSHQATDSKVRYYPVPLRDELIIQLSPKQFSEFEISLIEASSGKIVKNFKFEKFDEEYIKINISDISDGMYIFTIKSKGSIVSSGKIVKLN
jgi:hypothetical protein